jgi:NAD-dependent dihydropyrimidine dehydrogenase PreA subunit
MPVIINFKICDNAPECCGIEACPTKAFHYDYKEKTLKIDPEKCINCGRCACCKVGAIHFAKDEKEAEKIRKMIAKDKRKVTDLFVQRYGAQPIQNPFVIDESGFDRAIKDYPGKAVLEVLNDESIQCLVNSIPIKELFEEFEFVKYRKMMVEGDAFLKKFKIGKIPAFLFFENGKLKDMIEGYYDLTHRDELKKEISKFLS